MDIKKHESIFRIRFGYLRDLPDEVAVSELYSLGIEVISMERDAKVPDPNDMVMTNGWLRPRLIGYSAVIFVSPKGAGRWQNIYFKRRKNKNTFKRREPGMVLS